MFRLYAFSIIAIAAFLFVGCQKNDNDTALNNDQNVTVEQSSFQSDQMMTREDIADHLADVASKVPDVKDAVSLVAGPYAVVGIDIDETVERQEAGTIKYTVLEALEHDPYGRQAIVIADADIMERLREMKKDIQNGAPIQGVAEELGNVVSRYMPTFPIRDNQNPEDIIEDNQDRHQQR